MATAKSGRKSLEQVFSDFCAFGSGKDAVPMMDNAKFAKLTRDLKVLDKKVTSTDVDIIFSKVKGKTERKITFAQFDNALKLLAEKKYPGDGCAYDKLVNKLTAGTGPQAHGTTKPVDADIVDRMTDTSKYTGAHKQRFDESGKGKGLEGRDSVSKGSGMSAGSASGLTGYVHGYKHEGTYDKKVGK